MSTANPRVNITLEPEDFDRLKEQAKHHHLGSQPGTFARVLILQRLEELDRKDRS